MVTPAQQYNFTVLGHRVPDISVAGATEIWAAIFSYLPVTVSGEAQPSFASIPASCNDLQFLVFSVVARGKSSIASAPINLIIEDFRSTQ